MLTEFLRRDLSPATVAYYEGYLRRAFRTLPDLTSTSIDAFIRSLSCSPGGKRNYFRSLQAFCRWGKKRGYLATDPTADLTCPRVPKAVRYAVAVDNLPVLLAACATVRDKLLVCLLADTGLRRAELASVRGEDVRGDTITVWGKGAKQRTVRFGPVTRALLQEWGVREGSLFGLTKWGLDRILVDLGQRTGIKCNAHAFRRLFATQSVRNGMNLFHVQSLLGHSTLTMTRLYAQQVDSEDAIQHYRPIMR